MPLAAANPTLFACLPLRRHFPAKLIVTTTFILLDLSLSTYISALVAQPPLPSLDIDSMENYKVVIEHPDDSM